MDWLRIENKFVEKNKNERFVEPLSNFKISKIVKK